MLAGLTMADSSFNEDPVTQKLGGTSGIQQSLNSSTADMKVLTPGLLDCEVGNITASDKLEKHPKRGLRFWMCIIAIMVCSFLMVFDLVRLRTYESLCK